MTPFGAAVSTELGAADGFGVRLNAGFFAMPDGGLEFHGGELGAGQLVFTSAGDDVTVTLAGGAFLFRGEDGAQNLRRGNGARDYSIVVGNAQAKLVHAGRPLRFGFDWMWNVEDYAAADPDPFTAANRDETYGVVASVNYGRLRERHDWLCGYDYARIEALAVNASYAQDDWVRWGSATQTDASDLTGHEVRLGYVPWRNTNLLARLYLVDAVTSEQDGKRLRLDFNWRF